MTFRQTAALFTLTVAASAQMTRSTNDGVFTEEQAQRGRAAYSQHCLECHGRNLTGEIENKPLVASEFITNWTGMPVSALFDRIVKTMPGDKPGTLSRARVADILAFILQFNHFPAGKSELTTKDELLQQIRFDNPPASQ
jgi:mono/diheme cytochrome c family protein